MIVNHQRKYPELSERDNSVLLTAFLTEETGQDRGVIFHWSCSCHVSLHPSLIYTNVSFCEEKISLSLPILMSKPWARKLHLKKPQGIVHDSLAATTFITSPAGTFCCFCWPLRTAFPPVCNDVPFYSHQVVKKYIPLWFIHPEIPFLSNIPEKDASIDVFARWSPFLNRVITLRM